MSAFLFSSPLRQDGASVATRLRDGRAAELRPLAPGEVESLQAVFEGLSPTSRADRYLVGVPRLTGSMRSVLTAGDGYPHVAWLASVDGRPAGSHSTSDRLTGCWRPRGHCACSTRRASTVLPSSGWPWRRPHPVRRPMA